MIWFEHIKETFKTIENLEKILNKKDLHSPHDFHIDSEGRIRIFNFEVYTLIKGLT